MTEGFEIRASLQRGEPGGRLLLSRPSGAQRDEVSAPRCGRRGRYTSRGARLWSPTDRQPDGNWAGASSLSDAGTGVACEHAAGCRRRVPSRLLLHVSGICRLYCRLVACRVSPNPFHYTFLIQVKYSPNFLTFSSFYRLACFFTFLWFSSVTVSSIR